ncbi:DUF6082 family protein [Streptomyces similanensis]|uniref:Uncharacterized protein n=1 Tax=Streptomyces similanensis TaxID=1274988 RepID=A0ABP9JTZ2_9ACTN
MGTWKKGAGRFGSAATGLPLATATLTPAARRRRLEAERLAARRRKLGELSSRRDTLRHQQRMHGDLDERELFGRLREIFQDPVMRDYWEESREQRATLEHTSDEARMGRMVDGLIRAREWGTRAPHG